MAGESRICVNTPLGAADVTYVWLSKREALDAGRGWWKKKTDEPGGSPEKRTDVLFFRLLYFLQVGLERLKVGAARVFRELCRGFGGEEAQAGRVFEQMSSFLQAFSCSG